MKKNTGKIIVFEGISGSGKGTQIDLLAEKLTNQGENVVVTAWNSDSYISKIIAYEKRNQSFSPFKWSILHATDFIRRYQTIVLSALQEGKIVLLDRYIYTSLVRDTIRGVPQIFLESLYAFVKRPDLTVFIDVDVDIALERRLKRYPHFGYYSSGMDLFENNSFQENWLKYQECMKKKYNEVLGEETVFVNGNATCREVEAEIWAVVKEVLSC